MSFFKKLFKLLFNTTAAESPSIMLLKHLDVLIDLTF